MAKPTAFTTDKNGITWLPLAAIRTDAGTQHRPALDEKAVEDYAAQMRAREWAWKRSPIKITKEGENYWMIGGFHRLAAAERADLKIVGCIVQPGTRRDAILASFSENRNHGVRLDNISKRNKVKALLADEEWRTWSNNDIAKRCGVSHTFVNNLRSLETVSSDSDERTYVNKQGSISKMGTSNIGKRTPKSANSGAVDQPKTVADLEKRKWYPVNKMTRSILFDAFDSAEAVQADERYKLVHTPIIGYVLQAQYGSYQIVPGLPPIIPMAEPTPSAPARTYPTGARGKMVDDLYYPAVMRLGAVHDEGFADHDECAKCPRYPGNKTILGAHINRQPFYATFQLIAPVAKVGTPDVPASAPVQPAFAERMMFLVVADLDLWGDSIPTFEEQFEHAADFWSEMARMGELPEQDAEDKLLINNAFARYITPTRLPFDPARYYPVDDAHKHVYNDPRLVAETVHSPYRAVIGHDLNLAPAFEKYQRIDCDLPCPVVPASAAPAPVAQPPTFKPNFADILNDKFYICDSKKGTIYNQPYDTPEQARAHVGSPFDRFVSSGKDLNELVRFERWSLFTPANGNGNGGKSWENASNVGKEKTLAGWESQGVANGQRWLAPLDFRILVETNLIDMNAETLKRIGKPLRQLVIDAVALANGQIDRAQFGKSVGDYVTLVSEKPVKAAAQ